MTTRILFAALTITAIALAGASLGCKEGEGPAERFGRKIDEAVSDGVEAAEEARERVRKGIEEATR